MGPASGVASLRFEEADMGLVSKKGAEDVAAGEDGVAGTADAELSTAIRQAVAAEMERQRLLAEQARKGAAGA